MDISAFRAQGVSSATAAGEVTNFYDTGSIDKAKGDPKKLAGMFEAMFYRSMFEMMRENSVDEEGLMDSYQGKQTLAMQHEQLSEILGQSGQLGIAGMIQKEMERQQDASGMLKA
jgi:Rod binding domain-containing protein